MDVNQIVSITDANKNFSQVAKKCHEKKEVYIFKNNKPLFLLKEIDSENDFNLTENEIIEIIGRRILKKYHRSFEELAK